MQQVLERSSSIHVVCSRRGRFKLPARPRSRNTGHGVAQRRSRPRLQRQALPSQKAAVARPSTPSSKPSKVPGDSGWDLFSLRKKDVKTFNRFREVEVIHARWAMLGVASFLLSDLSGSPLPWQIQEWTPQLLLPWGALLGLSLALLESYRLASTWGKEDVEERVYPGNTFDLLGLTKRRAPEANPPEANPPGLGVYSGWVGGFAGWLLGGWWWQWQQQSSLTDKELLDLKSKELRNGRLAMVSFLGVCLASLVTGKGPLTLLMEHLADPAHHNIVETLQL